MWLNLSFVDLGVGQSAEETLIFGNLELTVVDEKLSLLGALGACANRGDASTLVSITSNNLGPLVELNEKATIIGEVDFVWVGKNSSPIQSLYFL